MPLRFCMVTTFYPPHHFGGDAMYVYRLSRELRRRGHEVTVVYPPDAFRLLGGTPTAEDGDEGRVRVHRLSSHSGRLAPALTYLTGRPALRGRELRRVLENGAFDVVHFHNVSLVGGASVLGYDGAAVKLYTAHEFWLVCPMHVLWKLNREPCLEPQCLRCTLAFHRPPQLWRYSSLLERSVRNVDVFLAPSRFAVEMHRERGFEPPVRHLPYFVPDVEAADPHAHPRPYFVVVGRLERLKGIETLIDAFRRYDAADLIVVGAGTHATSLQRTAAGMRNVTFLGRRPFHELQSLYAGAVALLQPSVGYETFGMTVVEAFVQRTPAIVRRLGGLPEMIEDSGGGFVYTTNDELLDAMERLRVDPALRSALGERGRAAYDERWAEEPHIREYLGLIDAARGETAWEPRLHSEGGRAKAWGGP